MFTFCRNLIITRRLGVLCSFHFEATALLGTRSYSKSNDTDFFQAPNDVKYGIHSTKLNSLQKVQKVKKDLTIEHLETLNQSELIAMIIKQEAGKEQLKALLQKQLQPKQKKTRKRKEKPVDFTKFHKRHVLLKFCYLGWNYDGYAVQESTVNTIENHLFDALTQSSLIESRQTSNYHLCGRTDKGVSAFEQVISLNLRSRIPPENQLTRPGVDNELMYCSLLNRHLPNDIRAISWRPLMNQEYSARFDCTQRSYKYFFPRSDLNIEKMQEACQLLVGFHDFRNFCRMDVANGVVNFTRSIQSAEIKVATSHRSSEFDMFYLEIQGTSFLRQMIRAIVSVLLLVGKEKEAPSIVRELLNVERVESRPDYGFAAQIPLCLFNCSFKEEIVEAESEVLNKWVFEEISLKKAIVRLQERWCHETAKSSMVLDMLQSLRADYDRHFPGQTRPPLVDSISDELKHPHKKNLLDRQRGPTLENRVEHFTKKSRISILPID